MESTTVIHSSVDWWDLLLPLASTPDRRNQRLLLSHPKDTGKRVNGIAKVPKRKVFTEVGPEPSNVRSPVDALTHSATAPPDKTEFVYPHPVALLTSLTCCQ